MAVTVEKYNQEQMVELLKQLVSLQSKALKVINMVQEDLATTNENLVAIAERIGRLESRMHH